MVSIPGNLHMIISKNAAFLIRPGYEVALVKMILGATLLYLMIQLNASAQEIMHISSHGTVNILLANRNGIVVATDSRENYPNGSSSDTLQKLFRIDNKTVCSFAGFADSLGPKLKANDTQYESEYPLELSVAGLIAAYSGDISNSSDPIPFEKKVGDISENILSLLNINESANLAAEDPDPTGGPGESLNIMVAGFDNDGVGKIAQIEYSAGRITGDKESHPAYIKRQKIETISTSLMYRTAGEDAEIKEIMEHLERYEKNPVIKRYDAYRRKGSTESLNLEEMTKLASFLENETS